MKRTSLSPKAPETKCDLMSESTIILSESDELAREEKRERRMRAFKRVAIAAFILLLLFLLVYGAYDYAFVCRIPRGTTVVDSNAARPDAPCFDYFFRDRRFEKL